MGIEFLVVVQNPHARVYRVKRKSKCRPSGTAVFHCPSEGKFAKETKTALLEN